MLFIVLMAACRPLVGDWSGDIECENYSMKLDLSLEASDKGYEGEGELDCTDGYGSECGQTFDIEVRHEDPATDLDVDLDNCYVTVLGVEAEQACQDPRHVEWDGGDTIEGEWNECDVSLERD